MDTVLDTIETQNNVYKCVVDYISRRQVIMYDLTNCNDPLFRLIAIKWKLYHFDMRFAIFVSKYFPTVKLPPPVIISVNSIKYATFELSSTKPKRIKSDVKSPLNESSVG